MKHPATHLDSQHPTPQMLLVAYRQGIFPMADPLTGEMQWFSPDPRAAFPLDTFHTPRSLIRLIRHDPFEIRCNTSFQTVIRASSQPRDEDDLAWIDQRLIDAYCGLHEIGHAHCLEAWLDGKLVGGLYGVHIGGAFFGESMFSRPEIGGSNSSKICLVHLVRWLRHRGFVLLDTQFTNPHLMQFGCVDIPREQYLGRLAEAVNLEVTWGGFQMLSE